MYSLLTVWAYMILFMAKYFCCACVRSAGLVHSISDYYFISLLQTIGEHKAADNKFQPTFRYHQVLTYSAMHFSLRQKHQKNGLKQMVRSEGSANEWAIIRDTYK